MKEFVKKTFFGASAVMTCHHLCFVSQTPPAYSRERRQEKQRRWPVYVPTCLHLSRASDSSTASPPMRPRVWSRMGSRLDPWVTTVGGPEAAVIGGGRRLCAAT